MATPKKKTVTLTVTVDTYSAKVAFKDAQTIVEKVGEVLPTGSTLQGVSVR